jgi:hypothetical protein
VSIRKTSLLPGPQGGAVTCCPRPAPLLLAMTTDGKPNADPVAVLITRPEEAVSAGTSGDAVLDPDPQGETPLAQ